LGSSIGGIVQICDIEALARDILHVDRGAGECGWSFHSVSRAEIERQGAGTFDRRVRSDAFLGTHLNLRITDTPYGRCVSNMTIFVLHREQFEHVRFWRTLTGVGQAAWEKVPLGELPPCIGASTVVMHGYIEGPSQHLGGPTDVSYVGLNVRYVRFLIRLAQQCKEQCLPILIEVTGRAALEESRMGKPQLTVDDLTAEEIAGIGLPRSLSLPAERLARRIGLAEVPNVWNERTFGKVYCSAPRADRGSWLRVRAGTGARNLPVDAGGAASAALPER
jgi:hypothetical protein